MKKKEVSAKEGEWKGDKGGLNRVRMELSLCLDFWAKVLTEVSLTLMVLIIKDLRGEKGSISSIV